MALEIDDDEIVEMVAALAERLNLTPQDAVKRAVKAELVRFADEADFDLGLRDLYERFPKPEPTGMKADKAFFDGLSGQID